MSAREAAAAVVDPELRPLTIEDLGILRDVRAAGGRVVVTITPTWLGCPALPEIRADVEAAVRAAGHDDVVVEVALTPWSSADITPTGRRKLAEAGIAPPGTLAIGRACPRCGSVQTRTVSAYGPTPCRSLASCRSCGEPFTAIKAV